MFKNLLAATGVVAMLFVITLYSSPATAAPDATAGASGCGCEVCVCDVAGCDCMFGGPCDCGDCCGSCCAE